MTITTRDGTIAALVAGQRKNIIKASATSEGAGTWHSLWKLAGYPAAGANPPLFSDGSGYTPTSATTGALPFTNSAGANILHLLQAALGSTTIGTLILYDRLWACSGFGTVVTTAQNVTTPGSLPASRDVNGGLDVEAWGEVYTAPGATGATWTLTGVDSNATAGRTWTYTHPANAETVGQMFPFFPGGGAPGLMGMDQLTSFTASVSSGTAGNIGVTLLRRLASIPLDTANRAEVYDAIRLAFPPIEDGACIGMMIQCSATNTGTLLGHAVLGEG